MVKADGNGGLVKKEIVYLAVLIALVAGFLGGVIYSSYKTPGQVVVKTASQGQGQQQQAGLTEEQGRKIFELEKRVADNPQDGVAWADLGNVYYDTKQVTKSINAYNKSLAINSQQPEVWTDLGVMYRRNQQPEEALKAFDHAISLRPTLDQARFNKGIVLIYDLNDKAAGLKAWEEAVAVNPNASAPNGQLVKDLIEEVKNE